MRRRERVALNSNNAPMVRSTGPSRTMRKNPDLGRSFETQTKVFAPQDQGVVFAWRHHAPGHVPQRLFPIMNAGRRDCNVSMAFDQLWHRCRRLACECRAGLHFQAAHPPPGGLSCTTFRCHGSLGEWAVQAGHRLTVRGTVFAAPFFRTNARSPATSRACRRHIRANCTIGTG